MNKIQVHDKRFRLYMSEQEIQETVARVAQQISHDFAGKDPILCPVLTGSFPFAADLVRYLDFDPEVRFVRYSSYSGMNSSGVVKVHLPFSESCRGRHVIIVEDIVDTGICMDFMLSELQKLQPASISVCTFFFKPDNFEKSFHIDYIGKRIPNDFIVGYGLDYNDRGRTYPDVYIYDE